MKELDRYQKVMKKLLRYIKQDASIEQLEQFKKELDFAIQRRTMVVKKSSQN